MSLFGAKTNLEHLERELAEKEQYLAKLMQQTHDDVLFATEPESKSSVKSKPLWRTLHNQRTIDMMQGFSY